MYSHRWFPILFFSCASLQFWKVDFFWSYCTAVFLWQLSSSISFYMPDRLSITKGGFWILLNVHFSIFNKIHILYLDITKLSFPSNCHTLSFFSYTNYIYNCIYMSINFLKCFTRLNFKTYIHMVKMNLNYSAILDLNRWIDPITSIISCFLHYQTKLKV